MKLDDRKTQRFITLNGVTLRVRDKQILPETDWEICTCQNWAVLGPNGAGKSSLVGALTGNVPVVRGELVRHLPEAQPELIRYVSFDLEQRLIARDVKKDDARLFSGKLDSFEKSSEVIGLDDIEAETSYPDIDRVIDMLGIRQLLGRGIRFLSTGEMRKILIARALLKSPRLLILDEPFAGLDVYSKGQLKEIINTMVNDFCQLILVAHRFAEITPNITHIICLKDNAVFLQGSREKILASDQMDRLYARKKPVALSFPLKKPDPETSVPARFEELVRMEGVCVRYGPELVLDNLNWSIKAGENWAVLGPNGSGKSTLLNLIVGKNQQAYANKIYLFDRRRGSGESLWDIRKKIALVSADLQLHYRKKISAYDVILSGFFDSVGLYRTANASQHAVAREWIDSLDLVEKSQRPFDQLSYGEKRLVLIARAMVKTPPLLILDEPCQGLDRTNRKMILDLIEHLGSRSATRIVYVTHHSDEIPPCVTHILRLHKANAAISEVAAG